MEGQGRATLEVPTQLPGGPVQQTYRPAHLDPYIYQPLQYADSIRLLKFAASDSISTSLSCRITHARSKTSNYKALSYVWGAPIFSEWLHEEDSNTYIPITRNLYEALYRLGRRYEGQPWRVWVDAVCIDQQNLKERNHQVKNMASIFSKAAKVLVWLGPKEYGSVFSTLNRIASCCTAVDRADTSMVGDGVIDLVLATESLKDLIHTCDVVNLGRLFASPWFTRVWILQEFLLAKNIDFLMGRSSLHYETFELAVLGLRKYQVCLPRNRRLAGFEFERDYFENFKTAYEMFQARELRGSMKNIRLRSSELKPTMSLHQWCRMLVDRKCIDERDRVYAALGLATNNLEILPDYSLSFADICLDLAKKSLLAGDFSVLYDASTPINDIRESSLPSFTPSLCAAARKDCPSPIGGYVSLRYSAGLACDPMVRSAGPASIAIGGISVGDVVHTDDFADALIDLATGMGSPFKPQLLIACNRIASLYTSCPESSPSSSMSFQLGLWRTINLGFVPEREDVPYYEKGFNFNFLDLPYRRNIAQCFRNRVLFITSDGSFGMGPAWLRKGDKVVIFDGAETPFILRQVTGEVHEQVWRLVGDCYLEGWMHGTSGSYKIASTPPPVNGTENSGCATKDEKAQTRATLSPEFFTLC